MNLIKTFINKEISYFKMLHRDAQKLIFSIMLYNLIGPIFAIFINSFLWRQSHDLTLITFYNLIAIVFIPVGFYLNGILLKKFSPILLYSISLVMSGMAVTALIFAPYASYTIVSIFSIITGISWGVYWGNRIFLTLKTTQSGDRIYFSSIESSSGMITNVFVPLFIGWFIAFGDIIHFYSATQAYQIISVIMLIIIGLIALITASINIKIPVDTLILKNTTPGWKKYRLLRIFYGFNNGILLFVPTLMILILVGNEEAVGTVQSLSSIMASLIIYILAKYLDTKHRMSLIAASVILLIIGGIIFGIFYSALAVSIFFACYALSQPLGYIATISLTYDLIDNKELEHHYAYVCEQELFLDIGRVIAILLFMLALFATSNELALRFTPLIGAIVQIGVFFLAKSVEKHHANN